MNTTTIIFLVIAILLEHVAGLIVRRKGGSPLTRGMWILSLPFFILAVGSSDYLADINVWLRVILAIILGWIIRLVWLLISGVLTSIGI
jgi:hypothetical protein